MIFRIVFGLFRQQDRRQHAVARREDGEGAGVGVEAAAQPVPGVEDRAEAQQQAGGEQDGAEARPAERGRADRRQGEDEQDRQHARVGVAGGAEPEGEQEVEGGEDGQGEGEPAL